MAKVSQRLAQIFARPDWFSHVNRTTLRDDLFAGLTGATLVLPQGIALAVGTGLSILIAEPGTVATIGEIKTVLPNFALPNISQNSFKDLTSSAIAIGLVGLLEAMSIARALSLKSGQLVDSNREFVGQGLSNTVGGFSNVIQGRRPLHAQA